MFSTLLIKTYIHIKEKIETDRHINNPNHHKKMSELAAILARRRRISDGNFLSKDKPAEDEGDNVSGDDNNDNKNGGRPRDTC